MKTFKQIDIIISVTLIIIFLIASIIRPLNVFTGYFVVGGWQIVSMIIHTAKGWFTDKRGIRLFYHWVALILVIVAGIGAVGVYAILFGVMYFLLFAAPVMAIFYTYICYRETYIKMRRPLAVLK